MHEKTQSLTKIQIHCPVSANIILILCSLLSSAIIAQATTIQHEDTLAIDRPITDHGPSDPKELETFLDKYLKEMMDEQRIPGLAFVLVKDGKIFFAKGYGYSDLEYQKAVVTDKTLFRVGSISKLFTATAIAQLCDQGLIRLDTDVNQYLKRFQLDNDYSKPVTIANLLTHSAGFRGAAIGSNIRDISEVKPLMEYVPMKKIPQALPPGQVINYSNYGYNLAGYLVEEISGIPFAEYIDKNILTPLDMKQSSFGQKPDQVPELAKSYVFKEGNYEILPPEYGRCWPAPCGSLIGTAADMAHFMIAHVQDGRYKDKRILNAETAREMHQQQFANHPQLPGTCYGFYEFYGNNLRAIMHDGDISGFSSRLFLLPDHDLGFFVCHNGGSSAFRMQLTTAFLNQYFPVEKDAAPPQPPADFGNRAESFVGSYRSVRQDIQHLDKIRSITELIKITSCDEGLIWTNTQSQWIEIDSLLFQYAHGKSRMAFRKDDEGNITHLFLDLQQIPLAYERVAWYDRPSVTWGSLGFFSFVFLSSYALWPILLRRRNKRKDIAEGKQLYRLPRRLAICTVALNLVFIVGFSLFMLYFADMLEYGVPFLVKALLVIPIITTILAAALLFYGLLVWSRGYWSLVERLHYSLVALTCTGLVIWCYNWNLLGFLY